MQAWKKPNVFQCIRSTSDSLLYSWWHYNYSAKSLVFNCYNGCMCTFQNIIEPPWQWSKNAASSFMDMCTHKQIHSYVSNMFCNWFTSSPLSIKCIYSSCRCVSGHPCEQCAFHAYGMHSLIVFLPIADMIIGQYFGMSTLTHAVCVCCTVLVII